ncbi:hypothetical protein JIN84_09720 [Luteolibacter yonseiensis]|uniref:Uncharacterized protein n=1 Tax=Luteolibacter yonseiensis TaxID=1144680 RepID=A0A934R422_9BACT|nr:hypothetical protein [Luteolibacter yonseiensis]MBK1815896.1 hypothetical protein [Luteolibacter yonseiensis]
MNRLLIIGLGALSLAIAGVLLLQPESSAPARRAELSFKGKPHSRSAASPAVHGFNGDLAPFVPPEDRRGNVLRLLAAGEDRMAQTAICEWFSTDPSAAREWLESQPSFENFQPAISIISKNIAESGSPADALAWAGLLDEGPVREQTVYEIYAIGRRYHWLSDEQIQAAPFSPDRVAALLNGAADD